MVKAITHIGDYQFNMPSLLEEALTHPSLGRRQNYQRLEFLGDRVLGLVMAETLLDRFPAEAEGKLNNRFVSLVRKETLSEVAKEAGLVPLIRMTPGAESEKTREKAAVQADVCEAVIGAIYQDGGIEAARIFILKHLDQRLESGVGASKDHKTRLQEWAQARGLDLPAYKEIGRSGPDHNPVFEIEVSMGQKGKASAKGTSKRDAQQLAAKALYIELEKNK